MIIDCISDLHGFYPELKGGDLLILAGDYTATDDEKGWQELFDWLDVLDYKKIVLIAGNHDNKIQQCKVEFVDVTYLCDSGIEFEGLKIWGTPWTRTFEGMNPRCMAFTMKTEDELHSKFDIIPDDTDILITHSPPFTIHDMTKGRQQVGSTALLCNILTRVKPKLHVFGHIHEAYGQEEYCHRTIFVNASQVNECYDPVNKPVRIVL